MSLSLCFILAKRTNKVKSAKVKLEQARLEQENVNEKMLLELMQAANNLDEARLETELSERSLEQAEENMKVSGKQYEVGLETLSDYLGSTSALAAGLSDESGCPFPIVCELCGLFESGGTTAMIKPVFWTSLWNVQNTGDDLYLSGSKSSCTRMITCGSQ